MGNLKSPQSPCVNKIDWQKIARAEVSSFAFVMPLSFIMEVTCCRIGKAKKFFFLLV